MGKVPDHAHGSQADPEAAHADHRRRLCRCRDPPRRPVRHRLVRLQPRHRRHQGDGGQARFGLRQGRQEARQGFPDHHHPADGHQDGRDERICRAGRRPPGGHARRPEARAGGCADEGPRDAGEARGMSAVAGTLRPARLGVETAAAHGAALLIWALALWHSWLARGLFGDGSAELLYMMQNGGYALFYDSRSTLIAVTQTPAAVALLLGVTDSAALARLLSAGLFFLPTAYYHACLLRARHDPVLLGAVLWAIAVVFVPTSFFIVGEYNTISPAILFATLVVATAGRPTVGDGILLVATAAMLLHSYETMMFYGPLVAGFIFWRLRLGNWRSAAGLVHGVAALMFLAAGVLALRSLLGPHVPGHVEDSLAGIRLFWTNLQFVLPLAALAVVGVAVLLKRPSLYLLAGLLLALAALCPLLWLGEESMRPFPKAHYHSRLVVAAIVAILAVAIWRRVLPTGRRWLLFGLAALIASLPADIVLSELWRRSLVEFQATIAAHPGLIAVEDTPFSREPYRHLVEDWALSSESLVLRRSPRDGIVLAPAGFAGWQFFDGRRPPP